ncbi:SDR family NAD(P)-dependent oxidoreductase [Microbacterium soli]|uniref:Glucose 1-dehydrogenase n=1 Tax=Microbacterium soli TaxID=446075 RepID=A0ABP7NCX9_9MICO
MNRRTVIVTGAGSLRGIGRVISADLARAGYEIAIYDRDEQGARSCAEHLSSAYGVKVTAQAVDVSDEHQVADAVAATEKAHGGVYGLVNNAGISAPTPVEEISVTEWERIFAVNVRGVFLMSQAVLPIMRAKRAGRIVNMSSVSAQRGGGIFGASHYSAAKAAVLGFTKAVAREVGKDGVRVNAVAPSMVDTDIDGGLLTPERKAQLAEDTLLGRLATPSDVSAAVMFLMSPESDYITGATIDVNGGGHLH